MTQREVVEPNREPDFVYHDNTYNDDLSFWFDESIVMERSVYYRFRRVEKKTGPRYQYDSKDFGWTSLTGCWITSYANQVIHEIEQARIRWMATKALEESLK